MMEPFDFNRRHSDPLGREIMPKRRPGILRLVSEANRLRVNSTLTLIADPLNRCVQAREAFMPL